MSQIHQISVYEDKWHKPTLFHIKNNLKANCLWWHANEIDLFFPQTKDNLQIQ